MQSEAEEAYAVQVREIVDEQLGQLELDKADQDWVLAYAINALPITEEGLPDIQQAYQVFQQRETERQRNWAKSQAGSAHLAARATSDRGTQPRQPPATPGLDRCAACRKTNRRPTRLPGRGRNPFPSRNTAMPQTAVSMASALKEAWTSDRMQKQFEDKNAPMGDSRR